MRPLHLTECVYLLQEAEKLKHENEELRKLGEDAILDQQLNKALQETDKLKLAADAYKKELLQQKVSELQAELAQTTKRLKAAEEQNTGSFSMIIIPHRRSCWQVHECGCCKHSALIAVDHTDHLLVLHINTAEA